MTRREWILDLGAGVILTGASGLDLDAAELPPGLYAPSRDHLSHALAGHVPATGGETELVRVRKGPFQPAFFSPDQFRAVLQLTACMLGETPEDPIVREVAEWIDLSVSEAAEVRAAARALSPAHRTLAVHYYGERHVRRLEDFDAPALCRDGLTWLDGESRNRHNRAFTALAAAEQAALVASISDDRPRGSTENAGTRFFGYLKERIIDGFYTSRDGLTELGYRGNAFYASPPGCEHLNVG